ncbi:MAG: hypothetical protein NXH97_05580 [Rhodobacteraceae bacterium]|nr:hypothetical protein [Paracoccaceae bacterium]
MYRIEEMRVPADRLDAKLAAEGLKTIVRLGEPKLLRKISR